MDTRSISVTLPLTSLLLALASGCADDAGLDVEGSSGDSESTGLAESTGDGSTGDGESTVVVMTTTDGPGLAGDDEFAACAPGTSESCAYGGPWRTAGVGSCQAAIRVCDEDGRWGACEGEVRPQVEDCSNDVDEDCDGHVACSGEVEWVRSFGQREGGVGGHVLPQALVIDRHERIWVTGGFSGALRIDGEGWDAEHGTMFLARLDRAGVPQLASAYTGADACGYGSRLAIGHFGTLAVSAANCGAMQLAPGAPVHVNPKYQSSLVGTFSEAGDFVRDVAMSDDGSGYLNVSQVVFDRSGALWVAANLDGELARLGEGDEAPTIEGSGDADPLLVKLGPDGQVVWADNFGQAGEQYIAAIDIDAAGDVWLAGGFRGTMQFAGGTLNSGKLADQWSMFVVKLNSDGAWQWGRAYSVADSQIAYRLRTDAAGGAVLSGVYTGPKMVLGDRYLVNKYGGTAMLAAKLDAEGGVAWASSWPCVGACVADSLVVDGAGQSVFSTLVAMGSVISIEDKLDPGEWDIEHAVVVKLDRDGALVWSPRTYRADAKLAVGPTGSIYMTGSYTGQVAFGEVEALKRDAGEDGEDLYVARARP